MKYNFLFSKAVITAFFCILIVLFAVLGASQFRSDQEQLALFIEVNKQCDAKLSENENVFHIYVPTEQLATQLIPYFCNNPVITKQFGQVMLNWGYDMSDALEFIGRGNADLIMTKENLMLAFKSEHTFNYKTLLSYPDYTAFFISLNEKPRLEKEYFIDKRIGLLDYPSSRSGYILPRTLFKQLSINVENLNIIQASSHSALRDLLAEGKVDLIASYWKQDDMNRFLENYITPISNNVSGSRWYFKMETQNTELACAINGIIHRHAKAQTSPYFKDVESYVEC
ncbi:hypothetical protein [Pseudoalteromonas piratica]|jgi:ABC-type phosphate/phosphonate transport system substrate-binding protein|uniref:Solute-binding protein family 3/N-terminal domain-containing protein n=1 Tax=Pseudoalteromonas piratica TaxID=1348114 RepID=A0A0A7EKZ3_9GAMM|nr:hypothetical protein [Pseudoalteromonas piratica]AIY67203.1 hypothetical protein OM33_19285 [Pseudoalteromonas piratica]